MVNSNLALDRTFRALADPTRRSMLRTLASGPSTISELAEPLPMSLVAASKHVSVLELAGLLTRRRVGRAQVCMIAAEPMAEAAAWLDTYRTFWTDRLDALERHLTPEDE